MGKQCVNYANSDKCIPNQDDVWSVRQTVTNKSICKRLSEAVPLNNNRSFNQIPKLNYLIKV